MHASVLSRVWLFSTPGTVAHQTPLSNGFHKQEYLSVLPLPPLRDLPDPASNPCLPASPALAGRFFTAMPPGKHIWAVVLREPLGGALYVRDREQKYGEDLRAARDMAPGNLTWISHILTASCHWQGIYGHTISFSLSHLKGAHCYFSWDGPICAPANTLCQRGQLLLLPREISDNLFYVRNLLGLPWWSSG